VGQDWFKHDDDLDGPGTEGRALEDTTMAEVVSPIGKGPDRRGLGILPVRRSMASRQERKTTREALDLNVLAVLPPDLTNQLTPNQEDWLTARLITYNDRQANLNLGIHQATLRAWLEEPAFKTAYEMVTLDRLNMQIVLNRLLIWKVGLKQFELLDHPSLKVQMQAMEQVTKVTAALAAAEAKKPDIKQQINVFGGLSPAEWARKALDEGLIGDSRPRSVIDLTGTGALGLPGSEESSWEAGPVHQDLGRDHLEPPAPRAVGLAMGPPRPDDAGEVPDHPQGPAAGGLLDRLSAGDLDGDLLPEQ
jgi:hypothetical protein